jgi:predicted transcriptional regulator
LYSLDIGLSPFVTFVIPSGKAGQTVEILGQGFTGSTGVVFNGVEAAKFTVVSDTDMTAVVPTGATSGAVVVVAPVGALTSNPSFTITK